jgi:NADH:ubiquinone oxidoreductase subunit K
MNPTKSMFLKKWVAGNLVVYPGLLGLLHPLIAHGFTGDHDRLLTTPQFIMHTISIFIFVFFLAVSRNKAFEIIGKKKTLSDAWPFLFFTPWVFWLGYYTLFVPFDILFMFLSIGIINAIQLRPFVKSPAKWIWQCILGYLLAAVAGILIGLGAFLRYYKDFQGISKDVATWTSISIPAAFVVAYYFRYILSKQIQVEDSQDMIAENKPYFQKVA